MTSGVADTSRSGGPPAGGELAWHTLDADQVLHSEEVDGQRGLSSAEAAARARRFGPNKLAAGKAEPRWHAFSRQYRDPMQLVLLAADIGTLSVISWAEQVHGPGIARTMGMVTFALFLLFFSIESKDQRDSAFSLDTFSDKTFVITTIGSFVLLVLSTVLGIFQTVMKTVRLDVRQWLICTAVALSVVVTAEIRKAVLRQAAAQAIHPADAPGPEPLPAEGPADA